MRQLYRQAAAQGLSYDSAVKVPLLAILASPKFLYREMASGNTLKSGEAGPLSAHSLASRLSFFLWGSIPDEELLLLASKNKLLDLEALRAQSRRMLKDMRARSLAIDFAGQLWGFSDFEQFNVPDGERFPEFTPQLRRALWEEVVLFLDDLFRSDRPLTLLIDADYTFANELLSNHYGLQPTSGHVVSLPPERRGLPGMGLFLTKTSLPLRTSPVQRGVWISEQFLGREIPSPPAMVDPISEDETDAVGLTTREQLERHRANKICAACHAKFDPFGIALENFDPIGRWRTTLREGGQLSNTDRMHDGRQIAGSVGLRDYLFDHRDEVLAHFSRKLLGYALGRGVQPGDNALLKKIQDNLPMHQYRLSYLVESIVTSPQFMNQRRNQ